MIDNHLVSRVLERLIDIVQPTTRSDVNGHWLPPSAATGICRARIRMRPFVDRAVGSMARSDNGETQVLSFAKILSQRLEDDPAACEPGRQCPS